MRFQNRQPYLQSFKSFAKNTRMTLKSIVSTLVLLTSLFALTACGSAESTVQSLPSPSVSTEVSIENAPAPEPTEAPTVEYIPTEVIPEEPLAARYNNSFILLEDYEREVLRTEAGMIMNGNDPATQGNYQAAVLEDMIIKGLITDAALAQGYEVTDAELEDAYQHGIEARGSQEAFDEWLELSIHTPEEWRKELYVRLLAAKIHSDVVGSVPKAAPQINARHILVKTREEAVDLIAQLEGGADFATLAEEYSLDQSTKLNGGDLGWFPRGTLTVEDLELAAFSLAPGERSDPVSTPLGYHVLEQLAFEEDREVSDEAALVLQQAALETWIDSLKAQSIVDRYVP